MTESLEGDPVAGFWMMGQQNEPEPMWQTHAPFVRLRSSSAASEVGRYSLLIYFGAVLVKAWSF